MFIPSINKLKDRHQAVSFMQRYSFATIVSVKDGVPVATHLPFIVSMQDDKIILKSHFAKVNPQATDSIDTRVLVIFTEPHAYISPKHYEKIESVPTWNYIAVHAYGKYTLLEGEDKKAALLKETINYYETDYLKQWDNLPDSFKTNMMKGITGFEIIVNELQAKSKLSQNKTQKEIDSIVKELGDSENTNEKDIAGYMSQLKKKE